VANQTDRLETTSQRGRRHIRTRETLGSSDRDRDRHKNVAATRE
jgi:hypothetical protein